ncbi:hypothetical protein B0H17DRAFT_1154206, partial [Mycena rosella]
NPLFVLDDEGRIIAVFVGTPEDPGWPDVIAEVVAVLTEAREAALASEAVSASDEHHRRGDFLPFAVGLSHGGGQSRPGILLHSKRLRPIVQRIMKNKSVRRVCGFQSSNFSASVHTQILPDAKNPANTNPRQNTVAKSRAHPSAISPHHSSDARRPKDGRLREASPDYELLVRDTDTTGFRAFTGKLTDEFDPDAGLPYCPRWNISSRRANAMVILASRLTEDEWLEREQADLALRQQEQYRKQAEHAMVPVAAELISVGALRKSLEREEIGPAPHGFQYIQLE